MLTNRVHCRLVSDLPLKFAECTWEEIAAADQARCVLVLPVGSTEPHGPHLPLATDVVISEGMALRAAAMLRESGLESLVLPPILYTVTDFASGFAGAISVRFETARDMVLDVLRSAALHGFRMFAVANSHLEPRHVDALVAAFDALREETGVAVAFPDKRRRRWSSQLGEEFRSGACHAGRYESSLVLADRPDLVRESVRAGLPPVDISLSEAIVSGKTSFREAGGDQAYFGSPAAASPEEGAATFDVLARMLVASVEETYRLSDAIPHGN
jgi:creatinine amidohydrolase